MELECVKFKEKMDSESAYCRHPNDYCQHRTSCIIHFMGQENKRSNKNGKESDFVTSSKKDKMS